MNPRPDLMPIRREALDVGSLEPQKLPKLDREYKDLGGRLKKTKNPYFSDSLVNNLKRETLDEDSIKDKYSDVETNIDERREAIRNKQVPTWVLRSGFNIQKVGDEVRIKEKRIRDLVDAYEQEKISHTATKESKQQLLQELLSAEKLISEKNTELSDLRSRIRSEIIGATPSEEVSGFVSRLTGKVDQKADIFIEAEKRIRKDIEKLKKDEPETNLATSLVPVNTNTPVTLSTETPRTTKEFRAALDKNFLKLKSEIEVFLNSKQKNNDRAQVFIDRLDQISVLTEKEYRAVIDFAYKQKNWGLMHDIKNIFLGDSRTGKGSNVNGFVDAINNLKEKLRDSNTDTRNHAERLRAELGQIKSSPLYRDWLATTNKIKTAAEKNENIDPVSLRTALQDAQTIKDLGAKTFSNNKDGFKKEYGTSRTTPTYFDDLYLGMDGFSSEVSKLQQELMEINLKLKSKKEQTLASTKDTPNTDPSATTTQIPTKTDIPETPIASTQTATEKQPSDAIKITEPVTSENKKEKPMSPEIVRIAADNALKTIEMYSKYGWEMHAGVAKEHVEKIIKRITEKCDDKKLVEEVAAELRAALDVHNKSKDIAVTPTTADAVATKEKKPREKRTKTPEPKTTETKTSPSAKKISLGAAAIAAGTLALGAVGPDQKQDQDFTYRLASVGNKIETPTNQIETVEKIGNVTVDTRLKTITINGNDSPLLLEALEKKGDYYIGSYNYGGVIKYIAVPDLNTLKSLSAAKNDEEIKILISPFANKVLDENPEMKGVSVVCGQSRTEDGVKRIISFNFKRQGSEVKEAKDGHITPKENPLAKEIFGKKYSEYVKEVSNKKLGELKNIPEGNIRVELQKLADILRVYKYNDWAQRETIDNLLKETLKRVV